MTYEKNKVDGFKKRRRNKWTIILFVGYLLSGSIYILFGHKMSYISGFLFFFASCILPFIASFYWIDLNTKTKWQNIKLICKVAVFTLPFAFLVFEAKILYKDFHLTNYKRLTAGVVVDTGSIKHTRPSGISYYANVTYTIENRQKQGICNMNPNEFSIGDSISIIYSFKDPDFMEFTGLKHKYVPPLWH